MLIPEHIYRAHYDEGMDQWYGDSLAAIRRRAFEPKDRWGFRGIDINVRDVLDGVMCLHSRTARLNGWHYIEKADGSGRRLMTREELDRDVLEWSKADIKRWRRTPVKGRSAESKAVVPTFGEAIRYAHSFRFVGRRVTITYEWKGPVPRHAVQMVAYVRHLGATAFPMTLAHGQYGRILRAFKEAGAPTAVLPHYFLKPADYPTWAPYIDRTWGAWG